MSVCWVLLPEFLKETTFLGRPVLDHIRHQLLPHGWRAIQVAEDDVQTEAGLFFDGRFLALPAPDMAMLLDLEPNASLQTTDGQVVAAWVAGTHTAKTALKVPFDRGLRLGYGPDAEPINDLWELPYSENYAKMRILENLGRSGVRFDDPNTVHVDSTVSVQPGARIGRHVELYGQTNIASNAIVETGCRLDSAEVGKGAHILAYSVINHAKIGEGAHVGPMAHLRPGTVLENDVKVGNFVEVKNTILHSGAKASHLTYLGDAEVGANANIGAGTITCNYDGYRKHRTTIGERAFIGSNSSLVAPVTVGRGAIVGAGSVITREVPEDALAVERSDQRIMPGRGAALNARNRALKEQK